MVVKKTILKWSTQHTNIFINMGCGRIRIHGNIRGRVGLIIPSPLKMNVWSSSETMGLGMADTSKLLVLDKPLFPGVGAGVYIHCRWGLGHPIWICLFIIRSGGTGVFDDAPWNVGLGLVIIPWRGNSIRVRPGQYSNDAAVWYYITVITDIRSECHRR